MVIRFALGGVLKRQFQLLVNFYNIKTLITRHRWETDENSLPNTKSVPPVPLVVPFRCNIRSMLNSTKSDVNTSTIKHEREISMEPEERIEVGLLKIFITTFNRHRLQAVIHPANLFSLKRVVITCNSDRWTRHVNRALMVNGGWLSKYHYLR